MTESNGEGPSDSGDGIGIVAFLVIAFFVLPIVLLIAGALIAMVHVVAFVLVLVALIAIFGDRN